MDFVEVLVESVEVREHPEEVLVDSVEVRVDCDVSVKCAVFDYLSQYPWYRLSPVV